MKLKKPSFYAILAITLVLGAVMPVPGVYIKEHGWIITALIMAMYFGIGVNMDISRVIAGAAKWREMLFAQFFLFIVSPLAASILYVVFLPYSSKEAMIGLMFVSSLATPISSGIMLTESKHGNSVLSMYNVVLSQFLGIFVTPFILSVFLKTQFEMAVSFSSIVAELALKMLLPFAIGQMCFRFREKIKRPAKACTDYSIFVILYSYVSFAVAEGYIAKLVSSLMLPGAALIIFLFLVLALGIFSTGFLGFAREDRISLLFTCTQKTIGMGIPLAVLFFPDNEEVALNTTLLIIVYYVLSMIFSIFSVDLLFKADRRVCV